MGANAGINIVKKFEGCKLQAYLCPAGVPTIGWGHTEDVHLGDVITKEQAENLLATDYMIAEKQVKNTSVVPLNENQLGALTSFVFNLGIGSFAMSTLRTKLNRGDYQGAADEFPKWVFAKKKKLKGLVARRLAERELFLK